MDTDEFRRCGHELVDWVADYLGRVEELPVGSQVAPGDIRAALPAAPPEHGEAFADILADLDRVVVPGLTHWQSPNFFGYFPANASGPAILGELAAAGLGVQGMLWATSPACTELEAHSLDWLAQLLGLPQHLRWDGGGGAVIQDSASSATLCALLAARERLTQGAATTRGVDRPLAVYASTQAHSSVEKAVRIAGHGSGALRLVDVDDEQRMRADALAAAMTADRAAGVRPCLVVATLGTTSSAAIDPLHAIGTVAAEHDAWLHVDAAYAGSAAVCPEWRWLHAGLAVADSYCVNPHKWMLVNLDCDAFYVADAGALVRALSVQPEYLRSAASDAGTVIDYRDWQVPLGRRFRALKLWFTLRWYGAEGLRDHIRRHVALAGEFAGWVAADPRFELAATPSLSLVCFRLLGGDEDNERLLAAVNATGQAYLTHTRLDGRVVLRLAVGSPRTERRHVEAVWRLLRTTADGLRTQPASG